MDHDDRRPDDAVDLPGRRATSPAEAHLAAVLRRAVAPAPAPADRPEHLARAAAARAQHRRHRRLVGGSVALVAVAGLLTAGVSTTARWGPHQPSHLAAHDTSAPDVTATTPPPSQSPTLGPMPQRSGQPASPLVYLTPEEIHSVFPHADSLDPNGESQWFDVHGHTWSTACGADSPLEGTAPLHSMQIASWGQSTPQPPDARDGTVYDLITDEMSINVFIFSSTADAEHYGKAFAASLSTCADRPGSTLDLDPSAPVTGQLDTGVASVFTYGHREGRWAINALAVDGRYAVMTWAQVPGPETDQGYVDAGRATAGLALIAAQRAAQANLP